MYVYICIYDLKYACMYVGPIYLYELLGQRATHSLFKRMRTVQKGLVLVCHSSGEKQYKFEEILPHYKEASNDTDCGTFADFMEALKTFDREGQGFINAAELRHILTMMGRHSKSI